MTYYLYCRFFERGYDNPLFIANQDVSTQDVGRTFGNVTANYLPWSWVRLN